MTTPTRLLLECVFLWSPAAFAGALLIAGLLHGLPELAGKGAFALALLSTAYVWGREA